MCADGLTISQKDPKSNPNDMALLCGGMDDDRNNFEFRCSGGHSATALGGLLLPLKKVTKIFCENNIVVDTWQYDPLDTCLEFQGRRSLYRLKSCQPFQGEVLALHNAQTMSRLQRNFCQELRKLPTQNQKKLKSKRVENQTKMMRAKGTVN